LYTGTLTDLLSGATYEGWQIKATGSIGSEIEIELITDSATTPEADILTTSLGGTEVAFAFTTEDYGDSLSIVSEEGLRNYVAAQISKGVEWIVD
jgi:hypothetical protein